MTHLLENLVTGKFSFPPQNNFPPINNQKNKTSLFPWNIYRKPREQICISFHVPVQFFLALSSIWLLSFLSDLGFSCSVQLAFYYYNTFCEVGRNDKNVSRKLNVVVAS